MWQRPSGGHTRTQRLMNIMLYLEQSGTWYMLGQECFCSLGYCSRNGLMWNRNIVLDNCEQLQHILFAGSPDSTKTCLLIALMIPNLFMTHKTTLECIRQARRQCSIDMYMFSANDTLRYSALIWSSNLHVHFRCALMYHVLTTFNISYHVLFYIFFYIYCL